MSETAWVLVSVIPAALVVLGNWLVRRAGPAESAAERSLVYLLITGALLPAAIWIPDLLDGPETGYTAQLAERLFAPAIITTLVLLVMHLSALPGLFARQRKLAIALVVALVLAQAANAFRPSALGYFLVPSALAIAILWWLARTSGWVLALLSLLALAGVALFNTSSMVELYQYELPRWVSTVVSIIFIASPGVATALSAVFLSTGLTRLTRPLDEDPARGRAPRWSAFVRLALAALLLGAVLYTIIWASIWDNTSDGLGGLFLMYVAFPVAIAAGIFTGVRSKGWGKAAGFLFALLAPILISLSFQYGWSVSYKALTEQRAARIQRAVERYHQRNGTYPASLDDLTPRDMLWIPDPIIFRTKSWCYQGGADYYRLATFYREVWGLPFSLRVYASAGVPPEGEWACEAELAELKAQYDPPPVYEQELNAAVQTGAQPLPTSVISLPRTPVQPILKAKVFYVGSWSADGRYLVFGLPDTSAEPHRIRIQFLDVHSGSVCPAELSFAGVVELNGHHAWLPDGRLLFLSEAGELWTIDPCTQGSESRISSPAEPFEQVEALHQAGERLLLRSATAYWMLDGRSLALLKVADVAPNQYELHWDRAAWSPDGQSLAISHLNGQDRQSGSTLYIIDAASGTAREQLPFKDATDQSAPYVEWLSQDELLVSGNANLWRVDLVSSPPHIADLLQETFGLDAAYPNDFTGMASKPDATGETYHLLVRLNLPRNQAMYLYHSETGQVEIFRPSANPLVIFPDGELINMRQVPNAAPLTDEFELLWIDQAREEPIRLVVEGHLPRNYPDVQVRYLPRRSQLAFASEQGISLVSLPGGELLQFWSLSQRSLDVSPYIRVAPGEEGLLVVADFDGLYYIPLSPPAGE